MSDSSNFTIKHPTARTPHVCGECKKVINRGSKYRVTQMFAADSFYRHKMCLDCEVILDAAHVFGGFYFEYAVGGLFYTMWECGLIDEAKSGCYEGGHLVNLGMVTIEEGGTVVRPTVKLKITLKERDAKQLAKD